VQPKPRLWRLTGRLQANDGGDTPAGDTVPQVAQERGLADAGLSAQNEAGNGTVVHQRLYQLIREPGSITERTFEIAFLEPGVEGYVFTFG